MTVKVHFVFPETRTRLNGVSLDFPAVPLVGQQVSFRRLFDPPSPALVSFEVERVAWRVECEEGEELGDAQVSVYLTEVGSGGSVTPFPVKAP